MKQIRLLMGMPITIEIVDAFATDALFDKAYDYFAYVDATFSPFKPTSEVSRINRGELELDDASEDMRVIVSLAEITRQQTDGYFDIYHNGVFNPSGLVKGWAIWQAAQLLRREGCENFYIDAGGDIQAYGYNAAGKPWQVGIRNPFEPSTIVKSLSLSNCGIATSGLYERGKHIYNPHKADDAFDQIASITVIGPNVYEADRFATAAFAMGTAGIAFIASLNGLEGYAIDHNQQATMTQGFKDIVEA